MSEIIQDQIRDFKKRLKASIEGFTDELTSLYTFDFEADFADKVE